MARRSRQSFLKRQRERQRAEKAAEKRLKRFARRSGVSPDELEGEPVPGEPTPGEPTPGEPGVVDEQGSLDADPETADDTSAPAGTPLDKQD